MLTREAGDRKHLTDNPSCTRIQLLATLGIGLSLREGRLISFRMVQVTVAEKSLVQRRRLAYAL